MRGIAVGTGFVAESCYKCGTNFALTNDFQAERLRDRAEFFCPNGHAQHYIGKTEEERLREELERTKRGAEQNVRFLESRVAAEKAAAHGARVSAGRAKAKLDRAMKRVGAGVCPCCNRTFKQLAAHMKTKHKDVV